MWYYRKILSETRRGRYNNFVSWYSPFNMETCYVCLTLIELIWTITPALILILIAFPSFKLLYLMDEVTDPLMTIFVEGFITGGLKLHILNKIRDTSLKQSGESNNTLVSGLSQVRSTSFSNNYNSLNSTNTGIIFSFPLLRVYQLGINKTYPIKRKFHTKVKAINRIGPHNADVISVLMGSLLGDCYGSLRNIEGYRFHFKQSIIHKDYLFWLYDFFFSRGYCSNLKPRIYTIKIYNKKYDAIKMHYRYEFNTFTFRSFSWIHKMFYKKGKKIINPKIEQYLTPLALAIWIMDDGGWAKPGVRIATNNYKLEEVQILVAILKKLFDLNCTVQNIYIPGQYSIYIKGESIIKLRKLIYPYIIPSMRYKLGL